MFSIKGFVKIDSFIDNDLGETSVFGELSTHSRTYSREITEYNDPAIAPDVELVSFSSQRTIFGKIPVPVEYRDQTLEIIQWIYNETVAGRVTNSSVNLVTNLLNEFDEVASDFQCGEMTTDGTYWMPEYLTFKVLGVDDPESPGSEEDNQIKLWFADSHFRSQYDEYEIVVIPPIEPIDDLFNTYENVLALTTGRDLTALMLDVEAKINGDPYTYLRSKNYDWVDPLNSERTVPTNWTVAIYGIAGDNIDNIKKAITDWVLDNSTHTREEWLEILPDLFRITEFVIRPLWENYAVPNETLVAGLHSPVQKVATMSALLTAVAPGYTTDQINLVLEHTGFMYKSLSLLIVGHKENRDGINTFSGMFPDYMTVSTTSLDFARMAPRTQTFVLKLSELLIEAETMTEFSSLPIGFSRVIREGVMYVTYSYEDVNYLVVSKGSVSVEEEEEAPLPEEET